MDFSHLWVFSVLTWSCIKGMSESQDSLFSKSISVTLNSKATCNWISHKPIWVPGFFPK